MAFDYVNSFYEGGTWAKKVARRLNDNGVRCRATEVQIAKSNEEREFMTKYEKDIVFDWSENCLEVKSSTRDFTDNVLSYPFNSLFVDTVSGYDAKVKKPAAYVLISQISHGIVCISPKTYDRWRKVSAFDKKREINEWFYSAPKDILIPFSTLVEFLNNKQDGGWWE